MRSVLKKIGLGTTVWIIIFVIDYIITLYQINDSCTVINFTGLQISTKFSETELYTTFILTPKVIVSYIAFLIIWLIASFIKELLYKCNKNGD